MPTCLATARIPRLHCLADRVPVLRIGLVHRGLSPLGWIISRMGDAEESLSPVELLRSVPLFSDLEQRELESFSQVAVPRSFPGATRVFHEGDHSDACYIVRSGSFRVTREHSDGRCSRRRSGRPR